MLNRTERHRSALTAALKYFLFQMSTNAVRKRYLQVSERSSLTPNMLQSVIAKFHYTGPNGPDRTGPDQTKSAHFIGDRLNSTAQARPDPHGPARTFLRPGSPRNSVGSVRVSDKVRSGPCGSARVRSGPVGPV